MRRWLSMSTPRAMALQASRPRTCWSMCSRHCCAGTFVFFRWLKLQQRCVSQLDWKSLQQGLTTTCPGCFWWFFWFLPFWHFSGCDDAAFNWRMTCVRSDCSSIIRMLPWWLRICRPIRPLLPLPRFLTGLTQPLFLWRRSTEERMCLLWCMMSSEEHLREEPWGIDEPNKLLWRCATLRSSDSVLSRLRPKTWVLGMKPERPCRPTFERALKAKKFSLRLLRMFGTCMTTVMKSMTLATRFESYDLVPCAIGRTSKRSMPIQLGTLKGQGMRAVDAPPGMEFDW